MKKFVSIALSLSMIFALAVPTFAATTAEINAEIDRLAAKGGASASDIANAKDAVKDLKADVVAEIKVENVSAIAEKHKETLKSGTVTAETVKTIQQDVNNALPKGVNIDLSSIKVDGKKMSAKVTLKLDASVTTSGKAKEVPVGVATKEAPAANAPEVKAPSTSAPSANNPIKTTSSAVDMTNVVIIALAMASILGAAVVCTRKLGKSC